MSESHPPSVFSKIFRLRDSNQKPLYVVGGQAVNLWASRYLKTEPELTPFLPFFSKDIDFIGTENDLKHISFQEKMKYELNLADPAGIGSNLVGCVDIPLHSGIVKADFLHKMYGVEPSEANAFSSIMAVGDVDVRVPSPHILLQGKMAMLHDKDQKDRQDEKHVRIMMVCNRAFLKEQLLNVGHEIITQRDFLDLSKYLLDVVQPNSKHNNAPCVLSEKYGLNWTSMFPFNEMKSCNFDKIKKFASMDFSRFFPSSQSKLQQRLKKRGIGNFPDDPSQGRGDQGPEPEIEL